MFEKQQAISVKASDGRKKVKKENREREDCFKTLTEAWHSSSQRCKLSGKNNYIARLAGIMQEGWHGEDYLILFSEPEIEAAAQRYGLPELLPEHHIIGIVGWDDFIVRNRTGEILRIPTVPLNTRYLEPFELPESPLLESDERFVGRIKWYVKPLVFGGEPENESNITWVSHEQHGQLAVWWNQQYRRLTPAVP